MTNITSEQVAVALMTLYKVSGGDLNATYHEMRAALEAADMCKNKPKLDTLTERVQIEAIFEQDQRNEDERRTD